MKKASAARKIIFVAAACVFLFSAAMLYKQSSQLKKGTDYASELVSLAVTEKEEIKFSPAAPSGEFSPPGRQEKTAPIEVDFEALLAENSDILAWLYCPDTVINYPIVQSEDNEYYLHRLPDGSGNYAGSLFMDYRNAADFSHWNSIIYGHNMNNDTMFGTLSEYKAQEYFDAHPIIYLLTPNGDYAINLMAGFVVEADAPLYSSFSPDAQQREKFIESWLSKSCFSSGISPEDGDRLITLSTCSYEFSGARYVVTGILEPLSDR